MKKPAALKEFKQPFETATSTKARICFLRKGDSSEPEILVGSRGRVVRYTQVNTTEKVEKVSNNDI